MPAMPKGSCQSEGMMRGAGAAVHRAHVGVWDPAEDLVFVGVCRGAGRCLANTSGRSSFARW